ncbi:MAG: hypothetical protein ACI9ZV_000103 [Candidatus Azotimanducaceae bacterium]|jgi:hypothetical protein
MTFTISMGLRSFGILLVTISGLGILMGVQSLGWKQVAGRMINSNVTRDVILEKTIVMFQYSYEVDGQLYKNKKISNGLMWYLTPNEYYLKKWIISPWKSGDVIDVYVSKSNPKNAVLRKGPEKLMYAPFALGWILLLIGLTERMFKKNSKP